MSELIPIEDVRVGDEIASPWNTYRFRVTEIRGDRILGVFTSRHLENGLGYEIGSPAAYLLSDWRFSDSARMARKTTCQ